MYSNTLHNRLCTYVQLINSIKHVLDTLSNIFLIIHIMWMYCYSVHICGHYIWWKANFILYVNEDPQLIFLNSSLNFKICTQFVRPLISAKNASRSNGFTLEWPDFFRPSCCRFFDTLCQCLFFSFMSTLSLRIGNDLDRMISSEELSQKSQSCS